MELISSGVLTPFEVTFVDPSLPVQAWIYDVTLGSATLYVKATMIEATPGSYWGTFIPLPNKTYLVVKRVFTDGSFTVPDSRYAPSTESVQSKDLEGSGSGSGSICPVLVVIASSRMAVVLSSARLNFPILSSDLKPELGRTEMLAKMTAAAISPRLDESKILTELTSSTVETEIEESQLSCIVKSDTLMIEADC